MRLTQIWIASLAFTFLTAQVSSAQPVMVYKDAKAPLESRVTDLFSRLNQDEKLSLLSGTPFTTQPIPRLGVPAMGMVDAGQGVRGGMESTRGPATLFPAGVAMASTWDPLLVGRIGKAIGEEALNKGTGAQVLLGPAVNIQRSPLGGRNGEYFSEDPYLAGRLGVGYIQGMQSTGCGACLKHFACNNEEVDRDFVDVRVSERTLREIYLPAFEMAIKEGHPWTVMSSYNRVNGHHSTASNYLLTEVLRKNWGYDGMVMSDWGAVHETARVVAAGNDLEMPGPGQLSHDKLVKALGSGTITQVQVDTNVRRILRTILRVGLLDTPHVPDHTFVNSTEHQRLTFEAASQGIVLLKNEGGLLPLNSATLHSIALIGPAAAGMQMGAAGSPEVQPFYSISPRDGIKKRAGTGVTVTYTPGDDSGVPIPPSALKLSAEYFTNRTLAGNAVLIQPETQIQADWNTVAPAPGIGRTNFSVRWTGTLTAPVTGHYTLQLMADDGSRLVFNGKTLIDHWIEAAGSLQSVEVNLEAGHAYPLRVDYFQAAGEAYIRLNWTMPGQSRFTEAAQAAAAADVAIVVVSTEGNEGEGNDRPSMALPGGQDALIQAVAAANKRTIVVLNNGTPVGMTKWLKQVPGLIEAWFPGQEGGAALAAILFGDVNPSGKLPTTLAAAREDYPDFGHFPGVNGSVDYAEGIYVGYRHFDKANVAPLFPFGYGLSYTTFRYGPIALSKAILAPHGTITASVSITNTGKRSGAEVVEMYIHDPAPKIDRPVRELKGFRKVFLKAGETKLVSFPVTPRALAYCDAPNMQWKSNMGTYELQIGSSSRDIRQKAPLRLTSNWTEATPTLTHAVEAARAGDLAAGRPVVASSVEASLVAKNAVDSDSESRWGSEFSDPQWIAVDLGKTVKVSRVVLSWEDAYATGYSIQVSPDGTSWTDVYHTTSGKGETEEIKFTPTDARWVRMFGTKRVTLFGYSLFSFEVYK